MNYYLSALKKYKDFDGRARRKEYWMFTLFNFITAIILSIFDRSLNLYMHSPSAFSSYGIKYIGVLSAIYSLFIFLPCLGVQVRRLHDTNRSGLLVCLALIPVIGTIALWVLYCQDSTDGENEYGLNPKTI